jgi:hypothetical protein
MDSLRDFFTGGKKGGHVPVSLSVFRRTNTSRSSATLDTLEITMLVNKEHMFKLSFKSISAYAEGSRNWPGGRYGLIGWSLRLQIRDCQAVTCHGTIMSNMAQF